MSPQKLRILSSTRSLRRSHFARNVLYVWYLNENCFLDRSIQWDSCGSLHAKFNLKKKTDLRFAGNLAQSLTFTIWTHSGFSTCLVHFDFAVNPDFLRDPKCFSRKTFAIVVNHCCPTCYDTFRVSLDKQLRPETTLKSKPPPRHRPCRFFFQETQITSSTVIVTISSSRTPRLINKRNRGINVYRDQTMLIGRRIVRGAFPLCPNNYRPDNEHLFTQTALRNVNLIENGLKVAETCTVRLFSF